MLDLDYRQHVTEVRALWARKHAQIVRAMERGLQVERAVERLDLIAERVALWEDVCNSYSV